MTEPTTDSIRQQRLIEEMTELAGGLAHELRNPLSTMMINLKLLAEDLADPSTAHEDVRRRAAIKVDRLRKEAERLQSLFDEFLTLTGPYRLQRHDANINAIVEALVEFFDPLAASHNVRVEVILPEHPIVCPVDENLLRQALLNLLVNAQQAMPDGGPLTVTTRVDGIEAVIEVADTGVGIAEADVERILRPFYSTKAKGNGLGLSITQRIIQEHGGRLTFRSQPGEGTTVTIYLPHQRDKGGPPATG